MRRLPIFLVLDVSESMAGAPLQEVEKGIDLLQKALMSDPMALETVHISIIAFAGRARVITPLTYILDFDTPKLTIGSGTNLTNALHCLMDEIDTKVKKNTPEEKGDWKPLVFFLTDGAPNDNCQAAIRQWKLKYGKYTTVAVLMGQNADATALKSLTENVIVFKEATPESFKAFFKWVTASVQTSSKELGTKGQASDDLAEKLRRNMDADLLAEALPTENKVDFLVLAARCQKTRKPYIMRYVRKDGSRIYKLDGAYPVEESYFELSEASGDAQSISAGSIDGKAAPCPHCGNPILGYDHACDKYLCLHPGHLYNVKCPWCGDVSNYGGEVRSLTGGRG